MLVGAAELTGADKVLEIGPGLGPLTEWLMAQAGEVLAIEKDKRLGGTLYEHLRIACRSRRKRYGRYDSRGRLAGKRMIQERPASVER